MYQKEGFLMLDISVTLSNHPKQKPSDESALGFGRLFTDHMFMMDYELGLGWHNARIVPYGDFAMDPAAMVFHYGQAIFEGCKCYRRADGGLQLFRAKDNLSRMTRSAQRMCMPALDEETAMEGLKQLIKIDADWVPHKEGTSLYIRPTMISTDIGLGVHASKNTASSSFFLLSVHIIKKGLSLSAFMLKMSMYVLSAAVSVLPNVPATMLLRSWPAMWLKRKGIHRYCGLTAWSRNTSKKSVP